MKTLQKILASGTICLGILGCFNNSNISNYCTRPSLSQEYKMSQLTIQRHDEKEFHRLVNAYEKKRKIDYRTLVNKQITNTK
ncbi:MAG: hypothetical protein WC867_08420 [Candidatus Pacearchaeota archaeon]|jgi:hypothetical protein